jgi:hypothetical protein
MHTAIVLDESISQSSVIDTAQLLTDVRAFADTIVVSTSESPENYALGMWITAPDLMTGLTQAIGHAASKQVLVVSSSLAFNSTDLSKLVAEIGDIRTLEHLIVAPTTEVGTINLPEISPENIIQALSEECMWPLTCIATTRRALSGVWSENIESPNELMLQALIKSIADGDTVRVIESISPAISLSRAEATSRLSDAARARCLQVAIDGMNIEELFPQHNWAMYSEESAATAFHTLTALFLRLNQPETALECLVCSEKLEESPRYFALQGFIHEAQGETLGAVASFVSSLQCYESRKEQNKAHYLHFTPNNIEVVKTHLEEGLEALNRKDNNTALRSFSDAIYCFDDFYQELGIKKSA